MKLFKPGFAAIEIKIKKVIFFGLIVISIASGCFTAEKKNERDYTTADKKDTAYLLKLIEKANTDCTRALDANFDIEGHSGKQKFKASGNIQFNDNPRKVKIVFHDAVFKTPITEIIQDGYEIKFYFPFDKILYNDNIKTINLKNYTNFDIDFDLVSDLSTGKIPLIKNYSIVKGLEHEDASGNENNKLIIINNKEYYETISFMREIPDKILWMNKTTKEKIEVYLYDPLKRDKLLFYKTIKIVSLSSDLKITIRFNSIKFNLPANPENIVKIKLAKDTKVININN
ncbi:MAG: hypothetical protein V1874_12480 [Spirochaetota bacterium]